MTTQAGGSIKGLKLQNQAVILKLIATRPGLSRADIAKITGLSKMTVGNIVAELVDSRIVEEGGSCSPDTSSCSGRSPIMLCISEASPCICGVSVKRGLYQVALSDLSGKLLDSIVCRGIEHLTAEGLMDGIRSAYTVLTSRAGGRAVFAVGISCIGPLNDVTGTILSPPNFYGIENLPIVSLMEEFTGLPTFLMNDGNAGALAEKTYGAGKDIPNFVYLHVMYGIGSGFVLENKLYDGDIGQSGEIGHSTINFCGPKCSCGNTGCLELYANIQNMRSHIGQLAPFYPSSKIARQEKPSIVDIVDAANRNDYLAISALDEYCGYLSHAMTNILNLLDLSIIIVDYGSTVPGNVFESILGRKLAASGNSVRAQNIRIIRSRFNGQAPVIGSIALVADKVFHLALPLPMQMAELG